MFNALRNKMVALAALAASFVTMRENPTPSGPTVTHHKDPAFRDPMPSRPRKGRPTLQLVYKGARPSENPAGTKLFKRFAEAGAARGPRGY